jgi:predicted AAA+ superfamily ATPase
MLQKLTIESKKFVKRNNLPYQRYFLKENRIKHRLSIVLGQRGVGKTTTIAQYMAMHDDLKSLYISMDSFLIGDLSMYEIAERFEQDGGKLLCFDEIHKYKNWSQELKSIYDNFPYLQIIASGSSALKIDKGSHDLSRRAHLLHMHGMSFREYLELTLHLDLGKLTFEDILNNHEELAFNMVGELEKADQKILPLFKQYLKTGYYPFSLTIMDEEVFFDMLEQNINVAISNDLLYVYPSLDGNSIRKLKLLVSVIMESVPFTPVIENLKTLLEIGDARTLKDYFYKLEDAGILKLLFKASSKGLKALEKPQKIYLDNSNLLYITQANIGTVRETFFLKSTSLKHLVQYPVKGDFLVDGKYLCEIGGKNKSFKQIKDMSNAFVVADDLEIGFGNKIPLWLFGFLY